MIKAILWDIDGTVLDFLASEKEGIRRCFRIFGLGECSDEMLSRYSVINRCWWEKLERGEATKPEVLYNRFRDFFRAEGIVFHEIDAFNLRYQEELGVTAVFHKGAEEVIRAWQGRYFQAAVTNGTRYAQKRKLAVTGLDQIFDATFISDEIGYEKPSREFFDAVFAGIPPFAKNEILIVGDSMTSDMKGGHDVGILCCHYAPKGYTGKETTPVDFRIRDFAELKAIVEHT